MAPFPRSCGEHALGGTTLKATLGEPPQLQMAIDPTLEQSTQAKLC